MLKSIRPEEQQSFTCLRTFNENLLSELEEAKKAKIAFKNRLHQAEESADLLVLKHPFFIGMKDSKLELELKLRDVAEKANIALDMVKLRQETIAQQQQTIEQLEQQIDELMSPPQYFPPQPFHQQHPFRGRGHRNN